MIVSIVLKIVVYMYLYVVCTDIHVLPVCRNTQ